MRLAVRRTVGVIGATGVAIGAAMVLALPASAHTPKIQAYCDTETGKTTVTISVADYNKKPVDSNWVKLDDSVTGSLLAQTAFSDALPGDHTYTVDGSVAHTFTMTVFAHDDADGSQHGNGSQQQWDGTFTAYTKACVTPPPTTTTAPPTTTTTVAPATTTTAPPTTTAATTTSEAVVAAASTTPAAGAGSLPFTGVNTALPLGIAGLLVVAGAGILFWLRFNARRRSS